MARRAAKAKRPEVLVPKATGQRIDGGKPGPWRNETHKARVVACGCLVARHGPSFARSECWGPVDPHHCRKISPPGWGQPSEALTVPLCRGHHNEAHEGIGGERGFQERYGIDFILWIERFSAIGALEISRIKGNGK